MVAGILALHGALCGCGAKTVSRKLYAPDEATTLDGASRYLKSHMRDGSVYVLTDWRVDEAEHAVVGNGSQLDAHRGIVQRGALRVPLDSVALFETNVLHTHSAVAALAVLTAASAALTVYCIANPKACFGSCPTFYAWDGQRWLLQAEGFSASVTPALEARDIDALWRARPEGREFTVRMTNEALETHVVRTVNVLAATRPPGGRIVATSAGEFREARELWPPLRALPDAGDVDLLRAFDGRERFRGADSTDLAKREQFELDFGNVPAGDLGLVLATRQSLLSTYLYYQTLAYLGRSAVTTLATLERGDPAMQRRAAGIGEALGAIEVEVIGRSGRWEPAGATRETGPIATDVRMIPLPADAARPLRVRIRLALGNWRIDQIAIAVLGARVEPERLRPLRVLRRGVPDDDALHSLRDSSRVLVTGPGDEYEIQFRLPPEPEREELFLETQGYYLEWIRQQWLSEENLPRAAQIFLDPAGALRRMAPEYKQTEAKMESLFWSSRYVRP